MPRHQHAPPSCTISRHTPKSISNSVRSTLRPTILNQEPRQERRPRGGLCSRKMPGRNDVGRQLVQQAAPVESSVCSFPMKTGKILQNYLRNLVNGAAAKGTVCCKFLPSHPTASSISIQAPLLESAFKCRAPEHVDSLLMLFTTKTLRPRLHFLASPRYAQPFFHADQDQSHLRQRAHPGSTCGWSDPLVVSAKQCAAPGGDWKDKSTILRQLEHTVHWHHPAFQNHQRVHLRPNSKQARVQSNPLGKTCMNPI